jgi:hypothetical protein
MRITTNQAYLGPDEGTPLTYGATEALPLRTYNAASGIQALSISLAARSW